MGESQSHLMLIPTSYEIPTDSIPLLSVCGTDDGRIFMGGYDGCLYEMSYEAHFSAMNANQRTNIDGIDDFDSNYVNGYGYTSSSSSYSDQVPPLSVGRL